MSAWQLLIPGVACLARPRPTETSSVCFILTSDKPPAACVAPSRLMQREECIYNLIPRPVASEHKAPRYQSRHDPLVQPTGSTFGTHGKTKLLGANLGEAKRAERPASAKGFGKLAPKSDPKIFIKKGERCATDVDAKKKREYSLPCLV